MHSLPNVVVVVLVDVVQMYIVVPVPFCVVLGGVVVIDVVVVLVVVVLECVSLIPSEVKFSSTMNSMVAFGSRVVAFGLVVREVDVVVLRIYLSQVAVVVMFVEVVVTVVVEFVVDVEVVDDVVVAVVVFVAFTGTVMFSVVRVLVEVEVLTVVVVLVEVWSIVEVVVVVVVVVLVVELTAALWPVGRRHSAYARMRQACLWPREGIMAAQAKCTPFMDAHPWPVLQIGPMWA